ncbi:MAG TPA: ABC transporter permease [Tardiphaga sp.]
MSAVDLKTISSSAPAAPWRAQFGSSSFLVVPGCIVIVATLLIPLAYVLLLSLNRSQSGVIDLNANFTMANYTKFFFSPFYLRVLAKTIYIAALTTALCAFFGAILAMAIWRAPAHLRGLIVIVVISPLLVSIVTRTFGWMIVLGDNGLINSTLIWLGAISHPLSLMFNDGAVIVGLVHVFLPLMVLPISTALDRVDPNIPQAANTLGASRFVTATQVVLPLATPGIVGGITIVFSLAMSSYITPALMGGPDSGMITTLIYQQFVVTFNWQFGAVLVAILLTVSLVLVGLVLFEFTRRTRKWMVRQ